MSGLVLPLLWRVGCLASCLGYEERSPNKLGEMMATRLKIRRRVFGLVLTAICFLSEHRVFAADKAERPNLVVIFTDDQVHNAIGYDNPEVHTPNLDALAAGGVIFERAYVASPICAASRASVMTGLFPQQNKAIALNHVPFVTQYHKGGQKASQTLAALMANAGYYTACYGKSHLGEAVLYGFDEGAERWAHDDAVTFGMMEEFWVNVLLPISPFFSGLLRGNRMSRCCLNRNGWIYTSRNL